MAFKDIFKLILSSCRHSVQRRKTVLAPVIEGNTRNISVNSFKIGPVVQEMSFKDSFIF